MDVPSFENLLGFLAILAYVVTLLPTTLRKISPSIKMTGIPKKLLQYRRSIGILAFALALAHGHLMVRKRNFDFFDSQTYLIYIQGFITFGIFVLLFLTSNDWSVRRLTQKKWKALHSLTYPALFVLIWHVFDKMSGHWTYLTPISVIALIGIAALFLLRLWIERKERIEKLNRASTLQE